MVSTKNGNAVWVANFKSNKKSDSFDRVIASINVVPCLFVISDSLLVKQLGALPIKR